MATTELIQSVTDLQNRALALTGTLLAARVLIRESDSIETDASQDAWAQQEGPGWLRAVAEDLIRNALRELVVISGGTVTR
ncbi:MAG: hypothetical protein SFU57_00165 [Gemmatimonadales bacterium]|nr:hypothetical protein [Gemmatimonadales bacterium]